MGTASGAESAAGVAGDLLVDQNAAVDAVLRKRVFILGCQKPGTC